LRDRNGAVTFCSNYAMCIEPDRMHWVQA